MTSTTDSPPLSEQSTTVPGADDASAGNLIAATDEPLSAPATDTTAAPGATAQGRPRRHARRARLYGYALTAVLVSAAVIALAASNTAKTKVSWIVGTSHV